MAVKTASWKTIVAKVSPLPTPFSFLVLGVSGTEPQVLVT